PREPDGVCAQCDQCRVGQGDREVARTHGGRTHLVAQSFKLGSRVAQHGEHGKMKLYSVITTVKEYSGCKNVIFRFRHAMPQGQRPYADLIKDYEPRNRNAFYVEAYIEELFTWDEARQLKAYLDQHHRDQGDTVIKEVTLPVENTVM